MHGKINQFFKDKISLSGRTIEDDFAEADDNRLTDNPSLSDEPLYDITIRKGTYIIDGRRTLYNIIMYNEN